MNKIFVLTTIVAGLIAAPAMAKELTARERAQLQAEAVTQASITRDLQDRAKALDKAYKAAKAIDIVIGAAASKIPYGGAAHKGGKAIGNTIYKVVKRGKGN